MEYPRVGIVLVHLNSYSDTSLCLKSLRTMTYPNVEVIVVDNGSIDGTGEILKNEFPENPISNEAMNMAEEEVKLDLGL